MIKTVSSFFITVFLLTMMRCSGGSETPPIIPVEEDTTTADIVEIDSVSFKGLKIYYPPLASISLFVGEEPDTSNFYIGFCCAAAYTDKSIYQHKGPANHRHVAGDHIDGGELYRGYPSENNTGGFVVYPYPDFHWEIVDSLDYIERISADDSSGLNVPPVSLSNVPGIAESIVPPTAETNVPGVSL